MERPEDAVATAGGVREQQPLMTLRVLAVADLIPQDGFNRARALAPILCTVGTSKTCFARSARASLSKCLASLANQLVSISI